MGDQEWHAALCVDIHYNNKNKLWAYYNVKNHSYVNCWIAGLIVWAGCDAGKAVVSVSKVSSHSITGMILGPDSIDVQDDQSAWIMEGWPVYSYWTITLDVYANPHGYTVPSVSLQYDGLGGPPQG